MIHLQRGDERDGLEAILHRGRLGALLARGAVQLHHPVPFFPDLGEQRDSGYGGRRGRERNSAVLSSPPGGFQWREQALISR